MWDVIIAGGGTAGSVLAARLSEDPGLKVLLIEAGPDDGNPLIRLPKGMAKLLHDPRYAYHYPTLGEVGPPGRAETILRGRMLGGSSGINGMVYHRGQPADYDRWVELGLPGWGWAKMQRCFMAIEDHGLGATEFRGAGGPIGVSVARNLPPLAEALLAAAAENGLARKAEPNLLEQLGAGPVAETIDRHGRRVSAARGFLTPAVRRRPNLCILTGVRVDRILFDGVRAVGVACSGPAGASEHRASREVVVATGAIESPKLLQISGVGDPGHLAEIGVPTVVASPGVGANYRDHFGYMSQWRFRRPRDSDNREFGGWRLGANALRYLLAGRGPMTTGSHQLAMFANVVERSGRADAEFLFAPYSVAVRPGADVIAMEPEPGGHFYVLPLRGTSQGWIRAASADPSATPTIAPNYLATDYDRQVTVEAVRLMRRIMSAPVLQPFVKGEIGGTAQAQSDEEIIAAARLYGSSCYHACGTCRMGPDGDPGAVLDARLRVRGAEGLRVVDLSVFPEQVSANTNGPVMAVSYRAAELVREDLGRPGLAS